MNTTAFALAERWVSQVNYGSMGVDNPAGFTIQELIGATAPLRPLNCRNY